jgi:hypothetical protein
VAIRSVLKALGRFKTFPFDVAIAIFYMCSGTFGLLSGNLSASSLSPVLGSEPLVAVFQGAHILGGLTILIGVLSGRGNVQAAGCLLLATNLLIRLIVVASGFPVPVGIVIGTIIPWLATIAACVGRIHSLIHHEVTMRVKVTV